MNALPALSTTGWTIQQWQQAYRTGTLTLDAMFAQCLETLEDDDPAWISRVDKASIDAQCRALGERLQAVDGNLDRLPLYGVPFAVKDNIDAAGWPTTAACPDFAYTAKSDATVVARLRAAGAILIGKTNLDQFATGLVGTRSPYGEVPNTFDERYVSGGSSSGSASVVARGVVPFSLGTDTAGSGRVPAGFNNIVGLKPTKGWLSTHGVVPACRTQDCVSVFALTVSDARLVAEIAGGYDAADPYSREVTQQPPAVGKAYRFAIPATPEFFGDEHARQAFEDAVEGFRALGATMVPVDFEPFDTLARLLYAGPWVAERFTVIEPLLNTTPDSIHPVVREIVSQASRYDAVATFKAEYQRAVLARELNDTLAGVDAMLVPTSPTIHRRDAMRADPITLNAQYGTYTNFTNLADMCALALPASLRADGLPAGVTLIAPAGKDHALAHIGEQWLAMRGLPLGATGKWAVADDPAPLPPVAHQHTRVAVVGAHLRGMPLNRQLTERRARFVTQTLTAPDYKLYALANSQPPKPALVRLAPDSVEQGSAIVVELWDVPTEAFGSFVAEIPGPLGIGTVLLSDGTTVKGFICEPRGLSDATDITVHGGWRRYLEQRSAVSTDTLKDAKPCSTLS